MKKIQDLERPGQGLRLVRSKAEHWFRAALGVVSFRGVRPQKEAYLPAGRALYTIMTLAVSFASLVMALAFAISATVGSCNFV